MRKIIFAKIIVGTFLSFGQCDEYGKIVTNHHIIEDNSIAKATIMFMDGEIFDVVSILHESKKKYLLDKM